MISDAMQGAGTDGTNGTDGTDGTKVNTLKAKLRQQRRRRADWVAHTVLVMTDAQRESLLCRLVGDVAGRYAAGKADAAFIDLVQHMAAVINPKPTPTPAK